MVGSGSYVGHTRWHLIQKAVMQRRTRRRKMTDRCILGGLRWSGHEANMAAG